MPSACVLTLRYRLDYAQRRSTIGVTSFISLALWISRISFCVIGRKHAAGAID
jgi:hypothetical protein